MWLGAAPLLSPLLSRVAFAQSGDVAPDQAPPTEAQRAEAVAAKAASATAELTVELARQAGEMAALRADFERRLREEQDKREAAIAAERERADAALKETRASMAWIQGLSLGGFAQTDLSVRQSSSDQLNNSTGEPLNQNRFVLRRARLRTEIDRGLVTGALELDGNTVNGPQMRVLNAEGTLRIPPVGTGPSLLGLTVGLFKIPFGWEVIQSDRDRLFLERSIAAQELFPGEYDLGARLAGGWRYIRYALAVQNGEPIGEKTFPVRDPNNAKDVAGRVGVETPFSPLVDFAAGFSGLKGKGFHKGTAATKAGIVWNDRNDNNSVDAGEIVAVSAKSATPSQNFDRHALGADLRVVVRVPGLGATTAYGEVTWAKNLGRGSRMIADPIANSGQDLRELGYYFALVQDIGRFLQVGLRYDFYDPNRDSTDLQQARQVPSSQSYQTWAFVAAARIPAGRLIAEYDVNRNHNGRDVAGLPTNLADNAFTLRAEVRF
jgi:hypothetical protein